MSLNKTSNHQTCFEIKLRRFQRHDPELRLPVLSTKGTLYGALQKNFPAFSFSLLDMDTAMLTSNSVNPPMLPYHFFNLKVVVYEDLSEEGIDELKSDILTVLKRYDVR